MFFSAKTLFGPGYSGLEYDYRGLLRLYHQIGNNDRAAHYSLVLQQWNQIRVRSNAQDTRPLDFVGDPRDIGTVVGEFFSLGDAIVRATNQRAASHPPPLHHRLPNT